jgi:hypothetical protein
MGAEEVVLVEGIGRTQRDCFLEALRLDPTNNFALDHLRIIDEPHLSGTALFAKQGRRLGAHRRIKRGDYLGPIRLDPTDGSAWRSLCYQF